MENDDLSPGLELPPGPYDDILLLAEVTRVGNSWYLTPEPDAPRTEHVEPIAVEWMHHLVQHTTGRTYVAIACPGSVPDVLGGDEWTGYEDLFFDGDEQ